jgi:hypothetical protein
VHHRALRPIALVEYHLGSCRSQPLASTAIPVGANQRHSLPGTLPNSKMQIRRLHLTPENHELRSWCEENKNRCYIPEWLLKAWTIAIDADLSGAA